MTYTSYKKQIFGAIKDASDAALEVGANEWRNNILKNLSGSRSGRIYNVPGSRKKYQASAPGESPASATGNLRTSVGIKKISDTEWQVGVGASYSGMLEDGTKKMSARPYFWKAYEDNKSEIQDKMKKAYSRLER